MADNDGDRMHYARKVIESNLQAFANAKKIGDRRGEANALGNIGNVYADLGDAHAAIGWHEKALVVVREIGDQDGEANILANLGIAHQISKDKEKGIALMKQALAIYEAIKSSKVEWVRKKLDEWE